MSSGSGSPAERHAAAEKYLSSLPGYYMSAVRHFLAGQGFEKSQPLLVKNTHVLGYTVTAALTRLYDLSKVEADKFQAVQMHAAKEVAQINERKLAKWRLARLGDKQTRLRVLDSLREQGRGAAGAGGVSYKGGNVPANHAQPVSEMGHYQEAMKKRPLLRNPLLDEQVEIPLFGNPFGHGSGGSGAGNVDEADNEAMSASSDASSSISLRRRRRKKARRYPSSSASTSASSNASSSAASSTVSSSTDGVSDITSDISEEEMALHLAPLTAQSGKSHLLSSSSLSSMSLQSMQGQCRQCLRQLPQNKKRLYTLLTAIRREEQRQIASGSLTPSHHAMLQALYREVREFGL